MLDDMKYWSFGEWCLFIGAVTIIPIDIAVSIYAAITFRMFI